MKRDSLKKKIIQILSKIHKQEMEHALSSSNNIEEIPISKIFKNIGDLYSSLEEIEKVCSILVNDEKLFGNNVKFKDLIDLFYEEIEKERY